ncbi:Pleiotropic drug resistance protein 3 [Camellia lanceoleosa]|uniref:Pleiotropic drug resistance protein 3 n=1 Tax=Camellia lanceoleosa TaxID=1840588 RepID=A0ACC0IPC5_9ERIC|nr:Pleiotropic drug resistance protein 3 [Camellia lanceoleosa]
MLTPLRKKLCGITGAFRPGVPTGLMGVSGAGKTTLMDVLAGRKTSGTIEGDIRIGGFPKVQETFLGFQEFVKEVLEIIEFDEIKDCFVGMPGVSGLSTEQRKHLTIDLELVANPSIIFMDEPTTGLDARAAAIVMRVVKNVAETGGTIVCTIHQPSIDIFEAFGELILLKAGGQAISGVQKIRNNYNPATWMLEITSRSAEAQLCVDFTQVYQNNKEHVNRWSTPPPGSKELYFASRFSQNGWGQFKSCLWKQHLSYWRSPSYNLLRFMYMLIASLFFGILFWDQGRKIGCNFTVSLLHNVKPVLWISNSSTANSQVVDMDAQAHHISPVAAVAVAVVLAVLLVVVEPKAAAVAAAGVALVLVAIGTWWAGYSVIGDLEVEPQYSGARLEGDVVTLDFCEENDG